MKADTSLTIATWNVNSLKARMEHVQDFVREQSVDIALFQETKCADDKFPLLELEALGYNLAIHGQKTYNGVAIASKYPIDEVVKGLPDEPEDEQARYIETVISVAGAAIRVASVYVPNGNQVGSDKFAYKMRFFSRMQTHFATLESLDEAVIIGGDFNVGAYAEDVYDHTLLNGSVCYHPDERAQMRHILHHGWKDLWRHHHPDKSQYSWWDYRANGYARGHGLRIDYLLGNAIAADYVSNVWIDEGPRQKDKASDHAPVVATIRI